MSIQRELKECREALAILAMEIAHERGDPASWRSLVKDAMEQAKENIGRDESQLERLEQYTVITRVGFKEPGIDILGSWQVGRTIVK